MFSLKNGDGGFRLRKGTKVFCRCEESGISELIQDYYHVGKDEGFGYDLEIVSLPELQVRKMFNDIPLYTYYKNSNKPVNEWDTKMLIIGFGSIGQNVLLQTLNLGVMHKDNRVLIDIYDTDLESKMAIFANHFNFDVFEADGETMTLKNTVADGTLQIRCHKLNVRFREFVEEIRQNSRKQPYTYVVAGIDDVSIAVTSAMRLSAVFDEEGTSDAPIILRMDSDRRLAKYLQNNDRTFSNVRLLDERSEVLTLDLILNQEINKMAKDFHCFYSTIQVLSKGETFWGVSKDSAETLWNTTPMFKRSSSKALAAHDETKQVIMDRLAKELEQISADEKIEKLIGTDGSLMKYDGEIWRLKRDDFAFLNDLMEDRFARSIAEMEHRRWCYFMISEGWRYGTRRNDERKIHTCLIPFKELLEDKKGRYTIKYDLMSMMARYRKNK